MDSGETNEGGPGASSTNFRQQVSVGGAFASGALSSSKFKVQPGFFAAIARAKAPSKQLDIPVLYARTQPAPYGTVISAATWQADVDPVFYWQAPGSGVQLAGYSYALDGTPDNTVDTTATFWNVAQDPLTQLPEGQHTFSVAAIAASGISGNPAIFQIWMDATPPTATSATPPSGRVLNTLAPSLQVTLSDALSGIQPESIGLIINGASSTVTFQAGTGLAEASGAALLKEGANTLTWSAADLAGNAMTPLVLSLTADVTPPAGSLMINGGALLTTSVYVTLNLTASDAISGVVWMLISNESLSEYVQEPFATVRPLWKLNAVKGTQHVYVKWVDGAGNESEPVSDDIGLDLLAPETVIVSGPAGFTPGQDAEFSFLCPEADCVFSFAFDHESWSAWSSATTATASGLAFGNHYFRVKAAREANGTSGIQLDEEDPTPAERTWIVGVESPIITVPPGPPVKLWRLE